MKQIDSKTFQFSDDESVLKDNFTKLLKQNDAENFVLLEMVAQAAIAIVDNIVAGKIESTDKESGPHDIATITYRYLTRLTLLNRETYVTAWNLVHKAGLPRGPWTYNYDTERFTKTTSND
jgi:hypothetical protein